MVVHSNTGQYITDKLCGEKSEVEKITRVLLQLSLESTFSVQ